jgi:hydroxymethylpyrimidine/phosphomethylpyrimidine kinase
MRWSIKSLRLQSTGEKKKKKKKKKKKETKFLHFSIVLPNIKEVRIIAKIKIKQTTDRSACDNAKPTTTAPISVLAFRHFHLKCYLPAQNVGSRK